VVEDAKEIEYKGKKLKSSPGVVGQLEVTKTEPGLAYCRVVSQQRPVTKDDKVLERSVAGEIKE
jgi:hypothetical protein